MSAPPTIGAALGAATTRLEAAGVDEARRDAQVLLGHVLDAGREILIGYPERPLTTDQATAFDDLVARRARREPVAYIVGEREFWSLAFRVTADTLVPRPASETVVAAALDTVADRSAPLTLLDLGTGSGCLLLTLLSELAGARGVGVDISPAALTVARANADRLALSHRARFLCADWGGALTGRFDLIVANPPYVALDEALAPEIVDYEPGIALYGGADPLDAYRALAGDLRRLLAPGGSAALEIGQGQAASVTALMAREGLVETARHADLAGIERCLVLRHDGAFSGPREKTSWNVAAS